MKRPLRFYLVIAAISIAAFVCVSCGEGLQNFVPGTEAKLTGLRIGSVTIPTVPNPIDGNDWDDEDFNLLGADVELAPLERSSDTVNVRLNPSVSPGARVVWGIGSQDMRPFSFNDRRVNATFEDADVLYFRVTSEDGEMTNYYRFIVWVRSPVTELAEVYIGRYETHQEESATGSITTVVDVDERMMATGLSASPTLQAVMASTRPGVLAIKEDQAAGAEIKVTQYDSKATIRFAFVPPNPGPTVSSAEPVFGNSKIFNLVDYAYLYIEVTAENTVDKAYYRFRVEVGRIATIKSLTFIGASNAKYGVANTGEQNSSWAGVKAGKFSTAEMPSDGFGVEWELDDIGAVLTYELVTKAVADGSNAPTAFSNPGKIKFDGTNVLAFKVVSKNTKATRYYRIEVTLLAAAFSVHPKSAYYYNYNPALEVGNAEKGKVPWFSYVAKYLGGYVVPSTDPLYKTDAQVTELSATLDRDITGTYQWYEANSWYGGYGFDAEGRIMFYPPGDSKAVTEDGFKADSYHVAGFDEKANVSFHNGGNSYYRLENPGKAIDGASGAFSGKTVPSYKPTIADKRPFIDGFTNETHYYWVEVKETVTQRTAVSKRAAIVTERDPRKKHHIVNLTDDVNSDLYLGTSGAEGYEKGYARNREVFKIKRETYKIPVTFPAGFNIYDYSNAMVQALFFLKDGTPWIQNWTQGDIGFEADDGSRLMYYNLTNNNGTLGLQGGGKEPSGGSLEKTPKYIIVKPAGEKPVWELPPLNADGTPKPTNDAQGWFCGFIELVEVRFEGPARR